MLELNIITKPTEKMGLAFKNNQIIDLMLDRPDYPQSVGSIFLGKVSKIDQGLQAAFIDIGQERLGYLELKQIPQEQQQAKRIASLIDQGQLIIVQVIKEAYQEKGARLTANVTIPGEAVVYLPFGNYVAVSKKLNTNQREQYKQLFIDACQQKEGVIVRTQAALLSIEQLIGQLEQLRKLWQEIEIIANSATKPKCLWYDHAVTDRFIRRLPHHSIKSIICDKVETANNLKKRFPGLSSVVKWQKDLLNQLPIPLEQLFQSLLDPVVNCRHGVTISIDQLEAATVIDVNSAGYTGKLDQYNFAFQVNKIAAEAIARQLRLRNLSGIILIDFIRMKKQRDQKAIIDMLSQHLKDDPIRTEVVGFTRLGLLELTRKREAPMHQLMLSQKTTQLNKPSLASLVYQLERLLMSMTDEAVVIHVTKAFKQHWQRLIQVDRLSRYVTCSVYFIETKGVEHYHLVRSGSSMMIDTYLAEKTPRNIDKII